MLVTNLNIARKCHDIKSKRYVPANVWRWLSNLNSLTLTALACTSLCTLSFNYAACISCFDPTWLQANKRRPRMRTNTTPDKVMSFSFFNTLITCQVLGTPNRQTIVWHDHTSMWQQLKKSCRTIPLSLVFSCCLMIADLIYLYLWYTSTCLLYTSDAADE